MVNVYLVQHIIETCCNVIPADQVTKEDWSSGSEDDDNVDQFLLEAADEYESTLPGRTPERTPDIPELAQEEIDTTQYIQVYIYAMEDI